MVMADKLLTKRQIEELNKLLKDCAETQRMCDMCAQCQINVDKESRMNASQMETARRIKQVFLPNEV